MTNATVPTDAAPLDLPADAAPAVPLDVQELEADPPGTVDAVPAAVAENIAQDGAGDAIGSADDTQSAAPPPPVATPPVQPQLFTYGSGQTPPAPPRPPSYAWALTHFEFCHAPKDGVTMTLRLHLADAVALPLLAAAAARETALRAAILSAAGGSEEAAAYAAAVARQQEFTAEAKRLTDAITENDAAIDVADPRGLHALAETGDRLKSQLAAVQRASKTAAVAVDDAARALHRRVQAIAEQQSAAELAIVVDTERAGAGIPDVAAEVLNTLVTAGSFGSVLRAWSYPTSVAGLTYRSLTGRQPLDPLFVAQPLPVSNVPTMPIIGAFPTKAGRP